MGSVSHSTPTLLIVGANHVTGSLSLRDRMFVEDENVPLFLDSVRASGLDNAYVISTCDRVETGGFVDEPDQAYATFANSLARHAGLAVQDLSSGLFRKENTDAVEHFFRVASSLDSVVVGEPQVLGQVKACHRLARDHGMVQGELEQLFQAAYGVAKRVRSETAIGERPVSIAAVAVSVARDVHGDLNRAKGVVLGSGEMGEVIARELQRAGLRSMQAVDLIGKSMDTIAQNLGIESVSQVGAAAALEEADVIVTAIGGRGRPLTADMVRSSLRARRYRPQFIIDASLPSDVEPAVDRLDDAFLYDIGDLERLAMEGRASREAEMNAADSIVSVEVAKYFGRSMEKSSAPLIAALRAQAEQYRQEALLAAGGDAEKATHLLLQKLMHAPSETLRDLAGTGADMNQVEGLMRQLFDLPDDGGASR